MKRIRVMADYHTYPLWISIDDGFEDNINPENLPISKNLIAKFMNWAKQYDAILNLEDPASSDFPSKDAEQNFINEGKILSEQLQQELGNEYEVIFQS